QEFWDIQQDKLEYCIITIPDPSNIFVWKAQIKGPPNSPYEGGRFTLAIRFPKDFPRNPPTVTFETSIFHPNITNSGEICLDILRNGWTPRVTIAKIILSVLSLMAFPMAENALNPHIALIMENSWMAFETMAREWTTRYAWFADSRPVQSLQPAAANSDKERKSKGSKKSGSDKKSKGSGSSKKGKK
ncbi:unnamed protein product, partial [Hydatigera taeniaeformis]|uniref:UBIQUITIN_CONJUGAT_2 domain-containing protein n=1 Tax=Hydatigena taeniaeformis TaxID=6205 RepID=A0A0R3WXH3_HYDTA